MSKLPSRARTPERDCVVFKDTSCVTDLWNAGLLTEVLALPFRFVIALPVKESPMLTIDRRHWAQLIAAGLEVVDLDERQVQEAMVLMRHHRGLSAEDGCSLVLARSISGSIVLSADAQSRAICERSFSLQAHDVLWTIDQLLAANAIATARLVQCLEAWRDDPMCHIPTVSIQQILRRINGRE